MTELPDPPQASGSPARRRFASAIEEYLAGKIDNFELDAAYLEACTARDDVCDRVGHAVWCSCYSDTFRHRYEGRKRFAPEAEAMVRRWMEILRSDSRWEWERGISLRDWFRQAGVSFRLIPKPEPNYFWPFSNEAAWKEWRGRRRENDRER